MKFWVLKLVYFSQKVEVVVEENPVPGKASLPKVKVTMVVVDKMKTKNISTWMSQRTCCFQVYFQHHFKTQNEQNRKFFSFWASKIVGWYLRKWANHKLHFEIPRFWYIFQISNWDWSCAPSYVISLQVPEVPKMVKR